MTLSVLVIWSSEFCLLYLNKSKRILDVHTYIFIYTIHMVQMYESSGTL